MSTIADRAAEADQLLHRAYHFAYGDGGDPVTGQALATIAVGTALLAAIDCLREIGDQLDSFPRPRPQCDMRDPGTGRRCHLTLGHDGQHRIGRSPS